MFEWIYSQNTITFSVFVLFFIFFILYLICKKSTWGPINYSDFKNLQADRDRANVLKRRYRNFAEAEIHGNESERLRIARELHDDTIHRIIILGQHVELLKYDNPDNPIVNDLDKLVTLTNDAIDHLRAVIKDLRPSHLHKLGLIPAIKGLVKEKNSINDCKIHLSIHGDGYRLNDGVETILYRLTQTAVQNLRLHSQCTEANISFSFTDTCVSLIIEDNGVGFDVPDESHLFDTGHYGLLGMKERAQICNGTFMIHSVKGSGTRLSAEIPKAGNTP